jgi:hypothetical protein
MSFEIVCGDLLQFQVSFRPKRFQIQNRIRNFQEQLKLMRNLDDKVIYALNNSLPTASIKARTESNPEKNCKSLFDSLASSYASRGKVIQDCILLTAEEVGRLKKLRDEGDDVGVEKKFKSEQRKVGAQWDDFEQEDLGCLVVCCQH